jgi:hypothetical protein
VVTPIFNTPVTGYCTTGSVSNKLLVSCRDSAGQQVQPAAFSFATAKSGTGLAGGVVAETGAKYSGGGNWTSSIVAGSYEIVIDGENYWYAKYTTLVTPVFKSTTGYCTTNSANNKLLVACFDSAGRRTQPLAFSFVTFKDDTGVANGVVGTAGDRYSGSSNWTASYSSSDRRYEITLSGNNNYSYTDYATLVTPTPSSDSAGYCTTQGYGGKLLVYCYDGSGRSVQPVAFSFLTLKQTPATGAVAPVYSSPCGHQLDGWTYKGSGSCVNTPLVHCDSSGWYCCRNIVGPRETCGAYPPTCEGLCFAISDKCGPQSRGGIWYGCYERDN